MDLWNDYAVIRIKTFNLKVNIFILVRPLTLSTTLFSYSN